MGALDDIDFYWEQEDLVSAFPNPDPKPRLHQMSQDRERRAVQRKWKDKNGDDIPYPNLGNGHLVNILLRLRRFSQDLAEKEAARHGFVLFSDGWEACKAPAWDGLIEELRSRGNLFETAADLIVTCDSIAKEKVIRKGVRR